MTYQDDAEAVKLLVEKVAPKGKLLRTWPLEGGISAQMTAFEVENAHGQNQKMILRHPAAATVRRNPYAARDEFKLLEMARTLGLDVPAPLYLEQAEDPSPASFLVIEYIEGQIVFSPPDIENYIFQLARNLAQIHKVDCAALDLSFLEEGILEFADALGERPEIMDESLDEERIRDTLEVVWPIPQRNESTLLHGDYWPGNIIWQDDQLAAVIDWEDAECGDPLKDLAISRLDLLWIFGKDAMMIFTDHYQSMTTFDFSSLPYWDLCAALRFIRMAGPQIADWAAFFAPYGRDDITEESIREHVRFFIRQAFEKLDL